LVTIDYFSDILCVWAYGGQIRLDELQRVFGDEILVRHRFVPLFADTRTRIGEDWQDKGGFDGFGEHLREVCAQWPHTHLSPDVWTHCRPVSCVTSHVFLKALSLHLGLDRAEHEVTRKQRDQFSRLIRQTRLAFFEQAKDVSSQSLLFRLLEAEGIAQDAVANRIENGEAYAALHRDEQLMKAYGVQGSPTYVFNEGRQLLYGNVGYRIIETNVRELMSAGRVEGEPSWC
jgi:predicted DsbA family dithiol-disulfide isomerase